MRKKILVTGATGFLGSRLVPLLIKNGYYVRCLVRKSSNTKDLDIKKNVEIVYGDITRRSTIKKYFEGVYGVVHLAVLGHLSDGSYENYCTVNVNGTKNIIEEAIKNNVKKIVYTTTTAALGNIQKDPITEADIGIPLSDYGRSKKVAEDLVFDYINNRSAPVVMLRFCHVYGPGEVRDLYTIIKMMKKGIFPQIGMDKNLYPAVYVDDAVMSLYLALKKGRPGQLYQIADSQSHDLREIRKIVYKVCGKKLLLYPIIPKCLSIVIIKILENIFRLFGKSTKIGSKNILSITAGRNFSIKKASEQLGYQPKTNLFTGLKKTIAWYKQEGLL